MFRDKLHAFEARAVHPHPRCHLQSLVQEGPLDSLLSFTWCWLNSRRTRSGLQRPFLGVQRSSFDKQIVHSVGKSFFIPRSGSGLLQPTSWLAPCSAHLISRCPRLRTWSTALSDVSLLLTRINAPWASSTAVSWLPSLSTAQLAPIDLTSPTSRLSRLCTECLLTLSASSSSMSAATSLSLLTPSLCLSHSCASLWSTKLHQIATCACIKEFYWKLWFGNDEGSPWDQHLCHLHQTQSHYWSCRNIASLRMITDGMRQMPAHHCLQWTAFLTYRSRSCLGWMLASGSYSSYSTLCKTLRTQRGQISYNCGDTMRYLALRHGSSASECVQSRKCLGSGEQLVNLSRLLLLEVIPITSLHKFISSWSENWSWLFLCSYNIEFEVLALPGIPLSFISASSLLWVQKKRTTANDWSVALSFVVPYTRVLILTSSTDYQKLMLPAYSTQRLIDWQSMMVQTWLMIEQ